MKFIDYFLSMNDEGRDQYALRCGVTAYYIRIMLACTPPRKTPRRDLMIALARESYGQVSFSEVIEHFYGINPCKNKRGRKC